MTKGKNKYLFLILLSSLVLIAACNNNTVFTESIAIPGKTWDLINTPEFRVPITDTLSSNNVMFTIRTGSDYPFRNIFLFVKTTSPDGRSITDTLEYYLADEKGKWYGRGLGDVHELNLPYKSNVFFPRKGIYRFTVRQGMRKENLNGVYDFGLRIEKTRK